VTTSAAVTVAPGPLATLVGLLQGLTAGSNSTAPSAVVVNSMLSVLAGNSTTLPLAEMATLLGLQPKTIPNPMTDPLGFITHPLIAPILLAAVTGTRLVYFNKYLLNHFLHVRMRAFLKISVIHSFLHKTAYLFVFLNTKDGVLTLQIHKYCHCAYHK
jgi:hypothetical protein